uniref:Uncharacterized protein n=1 Tax=Plectus sambesii TaxID=2011161 RepID=A0A914VX90_9BILA
MCRTRSVGWILAKVLKIIGVGFIFVMLVVAVTLAVSAAFGVLFCGPNFAAYFVASHTDDIFRYLKSNSSNDTDLQLEAVVYPALAYSFVDIAIFLSLKLLVWRWTRKCCAFLSKSIHSGTPFLLVWIIRRFILENLDDHVLQFWMHALLTVVTVMLFVPFARESLRSVQFLRRRAKFHLNTYGGYKWNSTCYILFSAMRIVVCNVYILCLFFVDVLFTDPAHSSFPFVINYPFVIFIGMLSINCEHASMKIAYELQEPQKRFIVVKQYFCASARTCHRLAEVLHNSETVPNGNNTPDYSVKIVDFANLPVWIRSKIPERALSPA